MRRSDRVRPGLPAFTALVTLLVLPALAVLTGCGRSVEVRIDPAPVQDAWAGCRTVRPYVSDSEANRRIDAGTPPVGFVATELIRCASGPPRTGTARTGISAVEERSDQVGDLLPTLALPTQQPRGSVSCPALDYRAPWLFLIDASGRWVTVSVPLGVCGTPREEFTEVYDALAFRTRNVT